MIINRIKQILICSLCGCVFANSAIINESTIKPGLLMSESGLAHGSSMQTLDKIVAFVNKGVITSNQLETQINIMRVSYKQKGIVVPDSLDFKNNVLNQMITLRVQLDLAQRLGVQTSDIEIANSIAGIAKSEGISVDQFKARLISSGINYDDFRIQVFQQITAEKLKQREVDGRIAVTDEEIDRVLNSEAYKNRVDYNLSYIMINVPEQSTIQVVQAKKNLADEAYRALKDGQSFNNVSVKYSNAPNALNGGVLGWKSNIVLPVIIANALKNVDKGDVSQVIQLPVGFLIFKVNDIKKVGSTQIVKQYHIRHILIKIGEQNSDAEAYQKIVMIKQMLAKYNGSPEAQNTEFIQLAKRYSEDASSINGGDIGWVSRGDTVPDFENMMLKTPIGQISEPIKTPFGWHILQVEGVRDSDKTNEVVRASIRQEIKDIKATLLYTEWLRNIREAAYVKINDY